MQVHSWWRRPDSWPRLALSHHPGFAETRDDVIEVVERGPARPRGEGPSPVPARPHPYYWTMPAARAVLRVMLEDLCLDEEKVKPARILSSLRWGCFLTKIFLPFDEKIF